MSTAVMDNRLLAAVVIGSCVPDDGIERTLARMYEPELSTGYYADYTSQVDCIVSRGGGCDAVRDCLGYTVTANSTCSDADAVVCSGTVAEGCASPYWLTMDCAAGGYVCASGAGCVQDPAASCDETSYTETCSSEGQPSRCNSGYVEEGTVCTELGLSCGNGVCAGTGDACTGGYGEDETVNFLGLSCNGTELNACVYGKTAVRDCSSLGSGYSCQNYADRYFCGIAAECDPGNSDGEAYASYCDGTSVVLCNAGRIEKIDCTSLGFTGCDLDNAYGCIPGIIDE